MSLEDDLTLVERVAGMASLPRDSHEQVTLSIGRIREKLFPLKKEKEDS